MKHVDIIIYCKQQVNGWWSLGNGSKQDCTCAHHMYTIGKKNNYVYGLKETLHVYDSLYTVSQGIKRNLWALLSKYLLKGIS